MLIEVGRSLHYSDQLVVDLGHLEFVQGMLGELGIQHATLGPDDQDELLGLARLRDLTDDVGSDLDVGEILAMLQQKAAAQRDGLVPVMGKNRVVEGVIGESHKPMDGGYPEPAEASQLPDVSMIPPDAGRGVRVGLVDTPPAAPQPGTPENPLPYRAGHAEFVASLIRRQAPAAEIHIEGVLDPKTGRADSWDTARAILRLVTIRQLDILNLSLGCYAPNGPPLVINRAIERLGSRVLVIAAAGNHGEFLHLTAGRTRHSCSWPAGIPPTTAVGSVDAEGNTAPFSPRASWVTCTTLGVDVVGSYLRGEVQIGAGTRHFDGLAQWSGTSFSAATVSGAVAARTVPGSVPPRQALADLLTNATLVRPFTDGS
ncbi:S8/S53 family peptidase [Streptomyces sp. NPDC051636]|uniref:S8/S53 family peptidase n=1 Tax=Streptomyces sp. NPDC051636 TaxID=3365663 RepID=UPI00378C5851